MINPIRKLAVAMSALGFLLSSGTAGFGAEISSAYSKLDFENGCQWKEPESEEEAQMGGEAVCDGYRDYPVYFAEGDLRQFLSYGPIVDRSTLPGGFGEWNSVHDTIEWRLADGVPFATIHRWFIENINQDTGSAEPQLKGQVLVIATVANPMLPPNARTSCVVGYVDAKANANPNVLAREVADKVARDFRCGEQPPKFYGNRGPLSGTPYPLQ